MTPAQYLARQQKYMAGRPPADNFCEGGCSALTPIFILGYESLLLCCPQAMVHKNAGYHADLAGRMLACLPDTFNTIWRIG